MQSYGLIMCTSYNGIYMPVVLICVETIWLGSLFAMAVLGCRSLVLVIIIINLKPYTANTYNTMYL